MLGHLFFIQGRTDRTASGRLEPVSLKLRTYLRVPVPAHCKALTRILLASHPLRIEMLRYRERLRLPVPRDARLCRLCLLSVETEGHALLGCSAPTLMALRRVFLTDIYSKLPALPRRSASTEDFLRLLLQTGNFDVLQRLAKYTYDVLSHYSTTPLFRPAGYA
jgi:hypothetical protein